MELSGIVEVCGRSDMQILGSKIDAQKQIAERNACCCLATPLYSAEDKCLKSVVSAELYYAHNNRSQCRQRTYKSFPNPAPAPAVYYHGDETVSDLTALICAVSSRQFPSESLLVPAEEGQFWGDRQGMRSLARGGWAANRGWGLQFLICHLLLGC